MNRGLFGTALMIGIATAAGAQQLPSTAQGRSPGKIVVTGKVKKVCETVASLGSIIPARICKTQEEWDQLHERSLVILGRMQDSDQALQNARMHKELNAGR